MDQCQDGAGWYLARIPKFGVGPIAPSICVGVEGAVANRNKTRQNNPSLLDRSLAPNLKVKLQRAGPGG